MDYTTLAAVKAALKTDETTDDALLSIKITEASRVIDFLVTGREGVTDYFKSESISDELLSAARNPLVDSEHRLVLYPHKPLVTAVSALSYRYSPLDPWQSADLSYLEIADGGRSVMAWQDFTRGVTVRAKLSYTGGLASTVDALPKNLSELATILTIRFYREAQSGMSDAIGIAELGTIEYSKALPARVAAMIDRLVRVVPW